MKSSCLDNNKRNKSIEWNGMEWNGMEKHETHTHTQVNELCDNDKLVQEGNREK
jgi:hypothetical protein